MIATDTSSSGAQLDRLVAEVGRRQLALTGDARGAFVGSELSAVDRVLARIRSEGLASGLVFCEWGSGLGGVCGVAALNGFTPLGIEIHKELVDSARSLADDLDLPMIFARGTFLREGDEDLVHRADEHTNLDCDDDAWDEMDLLPEDCDVVFAYPWPGEENFVDAVFSRHAAPEALLLTFHDHDRVLVQRKLAGESALRPLGWM